MSQKDKLLGRLLALSRNFTYDELETLLGYYMFRPDNKGKQVAQELYSLERDQLSRLPCINLIRRRN